MLAVLKLESATTITALKPLAVEILSHPYSFYKIEGVGLNWETLDDDARAFKKVIALIRQTSNVSDALFAAEVLPKVEVLLAGAEFFARLGFKDIIVTKGHGGTRPYKHVLAVAAGLNTSPVKEDPQIVFILRLSAILHDVGKGIAAGLGDDQVLKKKFELEPHSHPGHAVISALIAQTIFSHPEVAEVMNQVEIFKTTALIRNHHLIYDFKTELNGHGVGNLDQKVVEIFGQSYEYIFLLFLLMRSDLGSNPNYHKFWQENVVLVRQIVECLGNDLDQNLATLARACLALPQLDLISQN